MDGFDSNGESIEEEKGSHHNISLILDWGDVKKEPKGGSLNIESWFKMYTDDFGIPLKSQIQQLEDKSQIKIYFRVWEPCASFPK